MLCSTSCFRPFKDHAVSYLTKLDFMETAVCKQKPLIFCHLGMHKTTAKPDVDVHSDTNFFIHKIDYNCLTYNNFGLLNKNWWPNKF